jgi:4-hydroxythreonine-4-phosphate dehydrogenase
LRTHVPIIGISMGDPAGIGPEIAAKALSSPQVYDLCRPLIVGDAQVMEQAVGIVGTGLKVNPIQSIAEARFSPGTADVWDLGNVDVHSLQLGQVSAHAGKAAFEAVKKVIELALTGEVHATVTGPINKEAINLAGFNYAGHTEIFAEFTHTKDYTMMLVHEHLRVVHVSTHVALRQACDLVTKERVLKTIRLADQALKDMGLHNARIGVAGLNPHASDGGLFGREETEEIQPAVAAAQALGINAEGPIPPDTLFSKAWGGQYDAVVAMYHDQGHIPIKVLGFRYSEQERKWMSVQGVNITLGLPIIRVSVDHGTAYDQAGRGTASAESLLAAIEYASQLAQRRLEEEGAKG